MKTLLIQPSHYRREPEFFPLGLGYLARILKDNNHHVEILDIQANQYTEEQTTTILRQHQYDYVGVSSISTQYAYTHWLTKTIRETMPTTKIIVGNALGTFTPKTVLEHTETDICCIGEGEQTFLEIIEQKPLEQIKGIAYKKKDEIKINKPREYIQDIDTIPFPQWDMFPMSIYLKSCFVTNQSRPCMNTITARGCPYHCGFCSRTFSGTRLRSVNNIMTEIHELIRRYKIKSIFFNDELFVSSKKRAHDLCEQLQPLDLKWICQGRINIVNKELLREMKKAGCVKIGYGVESGSQRILNNMNKQIKIEDSRRTLNETYQTGLEPIIQMMYGYPGENQESLEETKSFIRSLNMPIGRLFLSVTTAVPGSPLYNDAIKNGMIKDEHHYLMSLKSGYMALTDNRPDFINFSDIPDKDFFRLKQQTEQDIYHEQLKRYPVHYGKITITKNIDDSIHYIQRKGLKKFIKKALEKTMIKKLSGA